MRAIVTRISTLVALLLLVVAGAGCESPKVVQGTVVSHDAQAEVLVVRDELPPHAELRFAIGGAEIGSEPRPGDVVRIACTDEGGILRATRIMNVTRQAERH